MISNIPSQAINLKSEADGTKFDNCWLVSGRVSAHMASALINIFSGSNSMKLV